MTNEEHNQEQIPSKPDAATGQPPASPFPPPAYTPMPPSPGTPPYMPAPQQPFQQPITESAPQSFPPPSPYAPMPQQPFQQPITGGMPQGYTPTPPPYPYTPAQQQAYPQYMGGGESTQAYTPTPPPYPYMPPVAPKKSNRGLKILLIVLAIIVVLGVSGGGIAIYLLTRPQPIITVTSNYKVGTIPAGSTSTTFHISGQKFSASEAITFLLDGKPAPGSQAAHSDKDGLVTTDLTIDDNWAQGNHTITARDADGYTTKIGSKVMVVPQGQAHTPGPNGAPPDDTSGIVLASIKFNGQNDSQPQSLQITGHADPQGGTVCSEEDNGKPITHSETDNGVAVTVIVTQTCSGTYKAGRLTYTETVTSAKFTFAQNGITIVCPATTPFVNLHLEGTFSNATTISGGASTDKVTLNCDHGVGAQTVDAMTGTWTGTM